MRRDRRFARLTIKLVLIMAMCVPLSVGCVATPPLLEGGEGLRKPLTIASIGFMIPPLVPTSLGNWWWRSPAIWTWHRLSQLAARPRGKCGRRG